MQFDVKFDRKELISWVVPGFYSPLKYRIGSEIVTNYGIRAKLVKIQSRLLWRQFSSEEKRQIKSQYGEDAKRKYHQFTRFLLQRVMPEQLMLPYF